MSLETPNSHRPTIELSTREFSENRRSDWVGFGRPALCLTCSTSGTGIRVVAPNCGKLRHLQRVFLEARISLMTRMGGATLPLPAFFEEQRQGRAGPQRSPREPLSKFRFQRAVRGCSTAANNGAEAPLLFLYTDCGAEMQQKCLRKTSRQGTWK